MQRVRLKMLKALRLFDCLMIFLTCQVNSYPTVRGFTAIGTGGDDFVQAMVVAVESVIQQPIPEVSILIFTGGNQLLIEMFIYSCI